MPVGQEHFYNRKEELDRLAARIEKITRGVRNDIAIVGPRRVGKSSLTVKLIEELKNKKLSSIQIDCEGLTPLIFLREYGNAMIEQEIKEKKLMQRFRETIKQGVSATIAILSEVLGQIRAVEVRSPLIDILSLRIEIEKIPESELKGEKLYNLFSKTIELPEKLGKKYVVFLDEFQETATYGILKKGDFHALFRRAVQRQKNVCYVYTGSSVGMMEDIFGNPDNPLAGNADIMRLGPFDKKNSMDFMIKGLQAHDKKIEENALNTIFEKTGGFPAYLNWVGLRLLETRKGLITKKEAEGILNEMLSPASAVYQAISKQLAKLGPKTKKILSLIALGNHEPPRIQRESGAKNVYVYLTRLQNYGLLKKDSGKFFLIDPVIAEGLRRGTF